MAIPRSNVMPLDLLYKSSKGVLERYNAPLYELFLGTSPSCPTVDDDDDMPDDISFEEELDLSLQTNIGLLDALTKLIKTKGSLKFSFDEHSNVVMSSNNVKIDSETHWLPAVGGNWTSAANGNAGVPNGINRGHGYWSGGLTPGRPPMRRLRCCMAASSCSGPPRWTSTASAS